jgi:hypothetical protein
VTKSLSATFLAVGYLTAPTPSSALDTQTFVDMFAAACVPQRLSYEGTKAQPTAEGWTVIAQEAHPELDALMTSAVRMIEENEEIEGSVAFELYARDVEGTPLHLVVTRSVAEMKDMDPFIDIGCYLYDFAASAPPDPEPVGKWLDRPLAREQRDATISAFLWGPACPMPRTGDTYMTYIPEGSPHAETTGFTGLMMKFATAEPEPEPGEVVPETYC